MRNYQSKIYSNFESLPKSYQRLLDEEELTHFDQTLPWYELLYENILKKNSELRIHSVEDISTGNPIAVLPTIESVHWYPIPGRKITPLGNYFTSFYEPVVARGQKISDIVEILGQGLIESSDWFEMDLSPMDLDSEWYKEIMAFFRKSGFHVHDYFRFGNWYAEIKGRNFKEFLSAIPKRQRETLRRKRNKLHKSFDAQVRIITSPDGLEESLTAYEYVYNNSWKKSEPFSQFIRRVVSCFAQRGWLRIGLLYVDKQPVAAQIWFVKNKTASIFKLAYDKDYSSFSVGSLLTSELMKYVIDVDHVRVIDYLSGDDDYKKDWMTSRRERWGLRIYRTSSIPGLIASQYSRMCRIVKVHCKVR